MKGINWSLEILKNPDYNTISVSPTAQREHPQLKPLYCLLKDSQRFLIGRGSIYHVGPAVIFNSSITRVGYSKRTVQQHIENPEDLYRAFAGILGEGYDT